MAIGASAERIKVLRVIGRLNVGGPAIHVVNLTAALDPDRYRSLLVAGSENEAEGSMLDFALSQGVRPTVIPEIVTAFSLTPRDGKALSKLYRLMREERPHIVHTHTAKAGFLGRLAARLAGVPVIVHTFHGHVLHGYYGPVKSELLRRLEQSLAWTTDRLVTVSAQVKKELVDYGIAPADKITVIPLGFDLTPFLNVQRESASTTKEETTGFTTEAQSTRSIFSTIPPQRPPRLRGEISESGLSTSHTPQATPHPPLIGIVGRLFPIKNHELFLEAAARVAAHEPTAHFVIVGDGVLRPELENRARALGIADRVLFTGWRSDLPRICADLNVLVVSSDNEGTPVSAIEAMAAGCPVVATRVGGLPDLIDDGRTGRLVPPRDAEALARAVLDLLQSPARAREIGNNAREFVRRRFTVQRLLDDMDRLYRELLEEKAVDHPKSIHRRDTEITEVGALFNRKLFTPRPPRLRGEISESELNTKARRKGR